LTAWPIINPGFVTFTNLSAFKGQSPRRLRLFFTLLHRASVGSADSSSSLRPRFISPSILQNISTECSRPFLVRRANESPKFQPSAQAF
jgi:hypothetical protein